MYTRILGDRAVVAALIGNYSDAGRRVHEASLLGATKLPTAKELTAEVLSEGDVFDFMLGFGTIPLVGRQLAEFLVRAASIERARLLPIKVDDLGRDDYFVLVPPQLPCLDLAASGATLWTESDRISAKKVGTPKSVQRVVLDTARIPYRASCFRIKEWTPVIVMTEDLAEQFRLEGFTGASFFRLQTI